MTDVATRPRTDPLPSVAAAAVLHPVTRARFSTGWWLTWLFGGLGLWWVLGLIGFIQIMVGLPLLLWLAVTKRCAVPRGFWIWLGFLGWMLLTVTQVHEGQRLLAFGWRAGLYLASTLLFLYVFNASREALPASRIINALAGFFAVTVIGGFIGMVTPAFGFPSPLEILLPHSLTSNEFMQALVHPSTTAARAFAGTSIHRPKAPFPYTNQWGASYAVTLPFAIAALRGARTRLVRRALLGVLMVSAVPLVISLDRGAWLSVSVGMGYAVLRLAQGRRRKVAFAVAALVGLLVLVIAVSPLGDLVALRLDKGYGDGKRALLYESSIDVVKASPLLGEGTPVPLDDRPDSPSVGTHGQLWTLLVSHGIPGTAAFCTFIGWMFLTTARRRRLPPGRDPDVRFWCNVSLAAAIAQLPYYELLPWGLPIIMCAGAVAWREQSVAPGSAAGGLVVRLAGTRWRDRPPVRLERRVPEPVPALAGIAAFAGAPPGLARPGPIVERHRPSPSHTRPSHTRPPHLVPAAAAVGPGRSELTHLAQRGSLSLVGAAVSAVLGFAYVVVLGRGLGAGGAGLVLEAVAVFTILANTIELGADTGLIRMLPLFIAGDRRRDVRSAIEVAFVPALIASVVAAGALVLFAPQLADVFIRHEHGTDAVRMLRILAPFLPLATLATLALAASRSFGSLVPYVAIQNVGIPVLRLLLTVASISLGLGIVTTALAWSIPLALAAVLSLAVVARGLVRSRRRERASTVPSARRRDVAREFWAFAAPRGLTGVLAVTLLWFDVLLVGAFLSTREAGVYASASRYVVAGTFALQALGLAIGPQVSRLLAEQRREEAGDVFRMATCWLMALSWPLYLTMAVFSPVLMGLFGAEFKTGATALTILALALLVLMGTGNNKIVLLMAGRSSSNLVITGVTLVLNVVLDLWLIPLLGINGAAIGWGVATVVDNVLTTLVLHRVVGLDPFGRGYPIVAGGALLCFGGVGLLVRSTLGASYPAVALYLALAVPPFLALLWRQREMLHLRAFRSMLRPGAGELS